MNNFTRCEKCKDWHWSEVECQQEYLVYHDDYMGDEPKRIRASDHDDAATQYAKYYNEIDYGLMNDSINVKVEKDGVVKWFSVGAEPDIYYSSKEIDPLSIIIEP